MAKKINKKSPGKAGKKHLKQPPAKKKSGGKKPVVKKKKEIKKKTAKKKVPAKAAPKKKANPIQPKQKAKAEKIKKIIAPPPVKKPLPEKEEVKASVPAVVMPLVKERKKGRGSVPKIKQKKVIVMQPVYPHQNKVLTKAAVKEPKGKFTLEYVVHASPQILYEFFSSPSGLSEWFADDVNITKDHFIFIWNGQEQPAVVLGMKDDKFIRFQWAEKTDGSYFEFRIETDDLTGDVSLMITDFSDESDRESSRLLWDSQVQKLMKVLGSY